MLLSKQLVFLRFFLVLKGLESPGRPVGKNPTNPGTYKSSWFRLMTKNSKMFTTIKLATIKVWAYGFYMFFCFFRGSSLALVGFPRFILRMSVVWKLPNEPNIREVSRKCLGCFNQFHGITKTYLGFSRNVPDCFWTFPEICGNVRKCSGKIRKNPENSRNIPENSGNFPEHSGTFPEISGHFWKFPEISQKCITPTVLRFVFS